MEHGTIGSMKQLGVTESSKLKRLVVLSASEAAEMIIRVDNIRHRGNVRQYNHVRSLLQRLSRQSKTWT